MVEFSKKKKKKKKIQKKKKKAGIFTLKSKAEI